MKALKSNPYTLPLLIATLIFLLISLLVVNKLIRDSKEKKYDEAYAEGFAHATQIHEESLKDKEKEIALNWWSGTEDFESTRKRLCENVNIKKSKPSKEK
jgi:hypothetical protein